MHPNLIDIEKFKYLKTHLAGAAKRAIEEIRQNEANYNSALKVVTPRYDRKDLIDERIDSLLQDLYEEIRLSNGCLDSLGMPSAEYAVLHRVLMRSLPDNLQIM
ncbi:hypothetical protein MTO96_050667 [Rhipicephalus appendiculatus]